MRIHLVAEAKWRQRVHDFQMVVQSRDRVLFEIIENFLRIGWSNLVPIQIRVTQMRDRRENVIGGFAFGRHGGVGDGWRVEIEREILRELSALPENFGNQLLIAIAEQDYVMFEMFRRWNIEAKINDEKRHGMAFLGEGFAIFLPARMFTQKLLIGVNHIGIRRDQIGVHCPPISGRDSRDAVAVRVNICDFGVELDVAANIFEQADEARYQCARPALGEPHAALTLQRMDEAINRGGREGVTANEERLERQELGGKTDQRGAASHNHPSPCRRPRKVRAGNRGR